MIDQSTLTELAAQIIDIYRKGSKVEAAKRVATNSDRGPLLAAVKLGLTKPEASQFTQLYTEALQQQASAQ